MNINLDRDLAKKILHSALDHNVTAEINYSELINIIINSDHKTYKYILITGLLAKATDKDANPLCLQVKSNLDGSYDARTLCHKVIVPFERDYLNSVLGGSNEPFLNKPARFKELSLENAVRRGSDTIILKSLIELFSNLESKEQAYNHLAYSLNLLKLSPKTKMNVPLAVASDNVTTYSRNINSSINRICKSIIFKSFEGKSAVIVIGTLEKLFYQSFSSNFKVVVHNVNQSGASSNEIGDIDIYYKDNPLYAIEVKDKSFTKYDIQHHVKKSFKNNLNNSYFIYNNKTGAIDSDIIEMKEKFEANDIILSLLDIKEYIDFITARLNTLNIEGFITTLNETLKEIKATESLKKYINDCIVVK